MSEQNGLKQKTCEACGVVFSCSASSMPCWCEEVKLTNEARAAVRTRFRDCVCPDCLAASARGEQPGKAQGD